MIGIRVEPQATDPPAGAVVLENDGTTPIRTWRLGNSWGDPMLSFELFTGATAARITRRPQMYTRNVPSSVEVPAGGSLAIPFDLGDSTWEFDVAEVGHGPGRRLAATYDVPASAEAEVNGVWVGRLRSPEVTLDSPEEMR